VVGVYLLCLCVFNLLRCCCVTFEIVLRPLLTNSYMEKFYCLDLSLRFYYRKPFKVLGYIYEKSDIY
jgi:hypothetical protein